MHMYMCGRLGGVTRAARFECLFRYYKRPVCEKVVPVTTYTTYTLYFTGNSVKKQLAPPDAIVSSDTTTTKD